MALKALKIKFIRSGVLAKDFPRHDFIEVAIGGRSNAGKSSFINALAGKSVAKVSQTPGKTRLLNFFNVNERYVLVDMPGYGFASRSGKEVRSWQEMIESYLSQRECLRAMILVMDIRREWSEQEQMIADFLASHQRGLIVVLNKSDKVSKSQAEKYAKNIKRTSRADAVFCVSAAKGHGVRDVEEYVFRKWVLA